jgi:hypothetical protein
VCHDLRHTHNPEAGDSNRDLNLKNIAITLGLVAAGDWTAKRFVLKDPNNPDSKGFVDIKEGFGLDDVAHAATITLFLVAGKMLLGKKGA